MQVEVRLFATLRYGRFEQAMIDVAEGATVRDLLERLDIPASAATLRLVNGRHCELDTPLLEGTVGQCSQEIVGHCSQRIVGHCSQEIVGHCSQRIVVSLFPPMGGG